MGGWPVPGYGGKLRRHFLNVRPGRWLRVRFIALSGGRHKENGTYYLSWGCFYATSTSVYGPFVTQVLS